MFSLFLLDTERSLAGGWLGVFTVSSAGRGAGAVWRLETDDVWPPFAARYWYLTSTRHTAAFQPCDVTIYRLGQPFLVHPHIQMESQCSSADRSGETELAPVHSKAVPSLPARSPGTCLMIMTVRVRRLLLLQLGGQEGKNRKIPEVDTQLSRDSRSKLQLTVIAGHNDDVHCHLPPYSR